MKARLILLCTALLTLSACASGLHGTASADQKGGRAKADVFKVPFP